MRSRASALPLLLLTIASACIDTTGLDGDFADVQGTWAYSAEQAAPVRQLTGELSITAQSSELIAGQLSYTETDGLGGVALGGGAVSGRVIDTTDVDFDVLLAAGTRRHVGRISADGDTVRGTWIALTGGLSGQFRLIRGGR